MRILIVEDTLKISEQLESAFKVVFPDAFVTVSDSIIEAEELLNEQSFDVISMDLILPDGNGLELAKRLKTKAHLKDTILLMITGVTDFKVGFSAYDQARCFKFITKPFCAQELLHTLYEIKDMVHTLQTDTCFVYNTKQMSIRIRSNDILYAEISMKNIIIHTSKNEIDLGRLAIKDLLPLLGEDFIQIHRGYIVNTYHLRSLLKSSQGWVAVLSQDDIKLSVGANYKDAISAVFDLNQSPKIIPSASLSSELIGELQGV